MLFHGINVTSYQHLKPQLWPQKNKGWEEMQKIFQFLFNTNYIKCLQGNLSRKLWEQELNNHGQRENVKSLQQFGKSENSETQLIVILLAWVQFSS